MKNLSQKILVVIFITMIVSLYANALTEKDSVAAAHKPIKTRLREQLNKREQINKRERKQEPCLCIIGSVFNENGASVSKMEISLFKDNEELVRQKFTGNDVAENLVFYGLIRNAHYSIVVSKEGYVSRLINISTTLPDDVNTSKKIFVFEFDVALHATNITDDINYLDFPIAIVSYNPISSAFENSDEYTQHIKEKIQSYKPEIAAK